MNTLGSGVLQDALEAIQYQKTSAFGDALTFAITDIRKNNGDAIYISKLCDVIKFYTKCKSVTIDASKMDDNAYMIPPFIDPSHQYFKEFIVGETAESELVNKVRNKKIAAGVNLATGELSGIFTELPVTIMLGANLLNAKSKYTARMVTAVLLHEIGHLITLYEALRCRVSANAIMAALCEDAFMTAPEKIRYEFIHKMELGNNKGYDEKILATTNSKEVVCNAIISGTVEEVRYATGYNIYDSRAFESVADQYVIRQGYGGDLASALSGIYNAGNLMTAFLNVVTLIMSLHNPGFMLIALLLLPMASENHDIYDSYKVRIAAIRNGLVRSFKDYDLPEKDRKRLLAQLGQIEDALDKVPVEYVNLLKEIGGVFLRIGAGARRERALQITLERLGHSESYLTAAKLMG